MIIDNLYPNIRSFHAMGMLLECLLSLAQLANFFSEVAFLFYSICTSSILHQNVLQFPNCLKHYGDMITYRQIHRNCLQRRTPYLIGESASRIHQHTAPPKGVHLQNSSTNRPPKGGAPLEFINRKTIMLIHKEFSSIVFSPNTNDNSGAD